MTWWFPKRLGPQHAIILLTVMGTPKKVSLTLETSQILMKVSGSTGACGLRFGLAAFLIRPWMIALIVIQVILVIMIVVITAIIAMIAVIVLRVRI